MSNRYGRNGGGDFRRRGSNDRDRGGGPGGGGGGGGGGGRGRAMTMPAWMTKQGGPPQPGAPAGPAPPSQQDYYVPQEDRFSGSGGPPRGRYSDVPPSNGRDSYYSPQGALDKPGGGGLQRPPPVGARIGNFLVQWDNATGCVYYYDMIRRQSQWECPTSPPPPPPGPPPPIHSRWTVVFDPGLGRSYGWDERTGQVTWDYLA